MPDVILATSINRRETVNALDRLGLPVFITDPHSVDEMIATVEHIGSCAGRREIGGGAGREHLRSRLADIDRRLAGSAPRRVLFVVWTDPLISVGATRLSRTRCAARAAAPWWTLPPSGRTSAWRKLSGCSPRFWYSPARMPETRSATSMRCARVPGWRNLEAIEHGNIVVVSDAINRPAPRMVDAVEQLARALHPDAFAAALAPFTDSDSIRPDLSGSDLIRADSTTEEACACAR